MPVEKEYVFDTEDGPKTLAELFDGRSQLIVYHFMFGPDWDEGCPSCSSLGDHIDLPRVHLEHHDVTWVAVSRAPLEKLLAYRERMGWSFPWVSSFGSDFNFDFKVSSTEERPLLEYNFREVPDERRADPPASCRARACSRCATASSTTPTRPTRAGWTRCGACSSGSTARRSGATRPTGYWIRRHDQYEARGRLIFAHVAGVPVEELLPFALVSGAGLLAAARAWVARLFAECADRPQLLLHDRHLLRDRGSSAVPSGKNSVNRYSLPSPLGTTRL